MWQLVRRKSGSEPTKIRFLKLESQAPKEEAEEPHPFRPQATPSEDTLLGQRFFHFFSPLYLVNAEL
jgi:hypothetical protein